MKRLNATCNLEADLCLQSPIFELKWSSDWSTGTVDWLSASERGQCLEGWPWWLSSAWFHFHSCQTWYCCLLRTVLMARQSWYHPKHSNQAQMKWATGVGLLWRSTVIGGRYNKCEPLRTFSATATHTYIHTNTSMRNWSWEMIMGFEALHAGRGRRNPVWSGKEAHWSLRGWTVKSAEHCGAENKPFNR